MAVAEHRGAAPWFGSFRARLTLRWTLAVGLLLGVANLAIYTGARAYLHHWLDHNVRTVAATEAASSTDGLADVHLHESTFAQFESGAFTEKLVQIFDRDGELVLRSSGLAGVPPLVPPDVIAGAFAGQSPMFWVTVHGRTARATVLTADRDGRPFAVAVGLFADEIEQGLTDLARLLAGVWLSCLIATAAIGYALSSRVLTPVARITERAAWIARGNFDARLDAPGTLDEVGRMTTLLNSMLERLQAAVEANRRFAADAAHELRSPLTAMIGQVDVTLRQPRSPAHYEETLQHVRGRLTALTGLAEDLMMLVRAQEGTGLVRREVPLRPLVESAFQRLSGEAAARGVSLEHRGLDGLQLYADPGLMARAIDNVIANGVLYNRPHGWVRVTATVEPGNTDQWVATMVQIAITDSGPGIPADAHDLVFERFRRLDHSRSRHTGGSGLGLAISREVATLHGGTVTVGQSSDAGTTILVRVPGAVADAADAPAPPSRRPAPVAHQLADGAVTRPR